MATDGKGETSTSAVLATIPLHRQVRYEILFFGEVKTIFSLGIIKMARLGLS
jgi:hypothetical protein